MKNHPDHLRPPDGVHDPDPRTGGLVILGPTGFRARTIHDQHDAVASITLHDGVPEDIKIQFETSRNLFLYAWFVYRFYPVVRIHAYACLEFALRERFGDELFEATEREQRSKYERALKSRPKSAKQPKAIERSKFRPGLKQLLNYAVESGHLINENFSAWRTRAEARARSRSIIESIEFMKRNNVSTLPLDNSELNIVESDSDSD
jgi:hypothetical protein